MKINIVADTHILWVHLLQNTWYENRVIALCDIAAKSIKIKHRANRNQDWPPYRNSAVMFNNDNLDIRH